VRRPPRSAAETGLEPRGVRGREGRRLPVVVPKPQVAAERRDSQRCPAPAPHGQLQSPSTENGQVSRMYINPAASPYAALATCRHNIIMLSNLRLLQRPREKTAPAGSVVCDRTLTI